MIENVIVLKVGHGSIGLYLPFAYCTSESAAELLTEQYKQTHAWRYTSRVPGHNEMDGEIIRDTVALDTLLKD
jgi:hypothetical protein